MRAARGTRRDRAPAVLLLAGLLAACAGPPDGPPAEPPEAPVLDGLAAVGSVARPLLWRIDGAEGGSLTLLAGVRTGPPGGWRFTDEVNDAFAASDSLVVEVDARGITEAQMVQLVGVYGVLPEDLSLPGALPPELAERLASHLASRGLPVEFFDRLRPWFAANSLAQLESDRLGFRAQNGVAATFVSRAGREKPVRPLESLELQFLMMSNLSPGLQALMLKDALLRSEDIERHVANLIRAWQSGDEPALLDVYFGRLEQHPELRPYYEVAYFDRSERIARALSVVLEGGGRHFAVIGAAHVIGARGVPSLLAASGRRVTLLQGSPAAESAPKASSRAR